MQSTSPDSDSKQADINLKLSVLPDHVTHRSPLLICYHVSDQHVGKWWDGGRQMSQTAAAEVFKPRKERDNRPTK